MDTTLRLPLNPGQGDTGDEGERQRQYEWAEYNVPIDLIRHLHSVTGVAVQLAPVIERDRVAA